MPSLDWIGKNAVLNHHREVPYHLLKCDKELSEGAPGSGNLLIQGDNLLALKALLPYYAGKVKCVYIDPPYNTGNESWVYNDNVNSPEIRQWFGKVVGKEAEDLSRHDKWLCMMYPRLMLLRGFLKRDGVIFVSIDDNELTNLMSIMGEVFGVRNHVATLIWEKGKKGDAKLISVTHEYVVVFAADKDYLKERNVRWRTRKMGVDEVLAKYAEIKEQFPPTEDDRGVNPGVQQHFGRHKKIRTELMKWYRSLPKGDHRKAHKHYNFSDDRGLYFADNFHGPDDGRESRPRYDILHPVTQKPCEKPATGWRWEEPTTLEALAAVPPRIHFATDHTKIPCRKTYLEEVTEEPFQSVFYTDGRAATREIDEILGRGSFPFPKDSNVLAEIIGLVTGPNDLILDSFAGSGTTGHAVLKLNQRERSDRRFILIELDDNVFSTKTQPRCRAAVEGYELLGARSTSGKKVAALGGGFRCCTLASPLFNEFGNIREEVTFPDLAAHVYFTETGEPIPKKARKESPLLGIHDGRAIYLLFNGILGDKRPAGGNVLTHAVAESLPGPVDGVRVVYGEACRLSSPSLKKYGIVFRQVPFELKVD